MDRFLESIKKNNNDPELHPQDKFQYLLQTTVEGSKAQDIVQSFPLPPSAESCSMAISYEYLKNRFGKGVLVEVYVRELLHLILSNGFKDDNKGNLLKLYYKIEAHLRTLETLAATTDKYSAMQYPLVEACLPENTLRTWERTYSLSSSNKT